MPRPPARTFQDLIVWQKSHALALRVYAVSQSFPAREEFGLTAQLRRAAMSTPANIAEGFKRRGRTDKARFINQSQGSLEETRNYLILARDLGYAPVDDLLGDADEVARLLAGYARALLTPR
jgi:four helix bundle protein